MFPTTMSRLCFRWTIVYISCCENSISCITNHCVRFLCYWPWCPCSVLSAIVSLSVFRVSTFVSVSCVISLLVHILLPHIVSIFCVTSHRVHILCYLTSCPHSVLPHIVSQTVSTSLSSLNVQSPAFRLLFETCQTQKQKYLHVANYLKQPKSRFLNPHYAAAA